MEKYQGFYRNRLNSKTTKTYHSRGGVCIYGKDNLDITEITDNILSHKDLEQIWCRVRFGIEIILVG